MSQKIGKFQHCALILSDKSKLKTTRSEVSSSTRKLKAQSYSLNARKEEFIQEKRSSIVLKVASKVFSLTTRKCCISLFSYITRNSPRWITSMTHAKKIPSWNIYKLSSRRTYHGITRIITVQRILMSILNSIKLNRYHKSAT